VKKAMDWKGLILAVLLIPITLFGYAQQSDAETAADPAPELQPTGEANGKKVLFDNTHGQTAGASDWVIDGAFSDFGNALAKDGYYVKELRKTSPITYNDLSAYDVFVIPEPNIPFKASEQDAMLRYTQEGGSIFFIGDHYNADRNYNRWDSGEIFNGYRRGAFDNPAKGMTEDEANSDRMQGVESSDWLGDNFGIRFRFNAVGDIESGQTVVSSADSFGITDGIDVVEAHAGATLTILDPTKAKGLIYFPENIPAWPNAVDQGVYANGGIDEGAFAAISKVDQGKAAFLGDSSPVEDATPKYLREDGGSTKRTYDGFTGEGNNGQYLLNVMNWLSEKENYASFEETSITLSEVTPLLETAEINENPELTTETEAEPWRNPPTGYRWYDPGTFAAGAYGSDEVASNPTYDVVTPATLPTQQEFTVRIVVENLQPGETLTGLQLGAYLPGGQQIGKFNTTGTWPSGYGYSSRFSVTADATGRAAVEVPAQLNPATADGTANLRVRQDGDNVLTKSVQVGNVATEPLPGDEVKLPDPVAIQEARTAADGEIVTLEGIVTSETGSFGGKGFYMQDDTAGIYVFQDSGSFQPGDRIQITGVKTTYNDEVELTDVIQSEVIGQADIPAPKVVSAVDETNQGQLVKLTEVTVTNVEEVNTYGTFEFDAKEADGHVTRVRVDNRIGLDYSTFVSQFQEGDIVNITGVSSIFNGIYQLKPVAPDNITDFVQTEEPVEEKPLPAPCKTDNGKHKGADKGKGKGKGHDKSWKCAA
jgi:DNA/RNA endonuclease YhcR with UshA esterase domain